MASRLIRACLRGRHSSSLRRHFSHRAPPTDCGDGTHDDQRIVIDEVIGQSIALSFCPPTFLSLILGFTLFRLFDITKPGPIGWADRRLPGAWGTLLDDVMAGIAAAISLNIIEAFFF